MSHPGAWARTKPDHPAVVMAGSGRVTTWRELDSASTALARVFRQRGVVVGDTVAVLAENGPELLIAAWAAQRSGLYLTAIDTHRSTADATYILDDSDAVALVTTADRLSASRALVVPGCAIRVVAGADPGSLRDDEIDLAEIVRDDDGSPLADEVEGELLLYSSGTTGFPKAIRPPANPVPMGQAVDGPAQWLVGLGATENSVYLSTAPLYHTAPLAWCRGAHRLGATVVVLERFDVDDALAAIERHRVTHSQWVPTMFVRMLRADPEVRERYDLSSMTAAVHAAAPCPVDVKRAMIDWWGPILVEYYSSTERIGATLIDSAQWLARPGSVGRAILGTIHVVDDDGQEVAPGTVGRIFFSDGPTFEYRGDPEKTAAAYDERGWATVGDLGYVDADGYLFLTDRKDFTIVSGGVNVYPQEIENILFEHPAVLDAGVFGIPDGDLGEVPVAVVQAVEGESVDEAALLAFLGDRLGTLRRPRAIAFADALPRTPTGKLAKRRLVEAWSDRLVSALGSRPVR